MKKKNQFLSHFRSIAVLLSPPTSMFCIWTCRPPTWFSCTPYIVCHRKWHQIGNRTRSPLTASVAQLQCLSIHLFRRIVHVFMVSPVCSLFVCRSTSSTVHIYTHMSKYDTGRFGQRASGAGGITFRRLNQYFSHVFLQNSIFVSIFFLCTFFLQCFVYFVSVIVFDLLKSISKLYFAFVFLCRLSPAGNGLLLRVKLFF